MYDVNHISALPAIPILASHDMRRYGQLYKMMRLDQVEKELFCMY